MESFVPTESSVEKDAIRSDGCQGHTESYHLILNEEVNSNRVESQYDLFILDTERSLLWAYAKALFFNATVADVPMTDFYTLTNEIDMFRHGDDPCKFGVFSEAIDRCVREASFEQLIGDPSQLEKKYPFALPQNLHDIRRPSFVGITYLESGDPVFLFTRPQRVVEAQYQLPPVRTISVTDETVRLISHSGTVLWEEQQTEIPMDVAESKECYTAVSDTPTKTGTETTLWMPNISPSRSDDWIVTESFEVN